MPVSSLIPLFIAKLKMFNRRSHRFEISFSKRSMPMVSAEHSMVILCSQSAAMMFGNRCNNRARASWGAETRGFAATSASAPGRFGRDPIRRMPATLCIFLGNFGGYIYFPPSNLTP
jgi:hypothetical protein